MAEVAPTVAAAASAEPTVAAAAAAAGAEPIVAAVDSPKHTMKLFSSEELDVTAKLSEACSLKDKKLEIFRSFKFHKLVLTSANVIIKEYYVNQNFFTSGGNGIVIGLHENPEASGLPVCIVKIGCSRGQLKYSTIANAIRAKELFLKFGGDFKDNMALYYGDILNESNVKIGEFALYKYLGVEILKHHDLLSTIAGKQQLIKLAIECIQKYQLKSLVHRDVCPENMVYDPTTNQVHLIDFDSMADLSLLVTEDKTVLCELRNSEDKAKIKICMKTTPEKCIDIFNLQPRSLTPDIITISKKLRSEKVTDPKQYLQSLLTMDYYGLFWIILYILLYPHNMDKIDEVVFGMNVHVREDYTPLNYMIKYTKVSKQVISRRIYELMPEKYNSNSIIMNFVVSVLELIKFEDRSRDFSLEKLLACDFLVVEQIQETITRMEDEQDKTDKEDLPAILDKIDQVTSVIQEYIQFRTTVLVRKKILKSNEDYKAKIRTMNDTVIRLNRVEEQYGGIQRKYSKNKKTNRYMNKKNIVGRYNTNKKSKTTKSR
jgi:serine/threonine protein kinase